MRKLMGLTVACIFLLCPAAGMAADGAPVANGTVISGKSFDSEVVVTVRNATAGPDKKSAAATKGAEAKNTAPVAPAAASASTTVVAPAAASASTTVVAPVSPTAPAAAPTANATSSALPKTDNATIPVATVNATVPASKSANATAPAENATQAHKAADRQPLSPKGMVVRVDGAFALTVPEGWETVSSNAQEKIPAELRAIFDGVDPKEKNVRLAGWKREGDAIIAAFAVSYIKKGGNFNKLMQAAEPEEKARIGTRFADTVATKMRNDYVRDRKMSIKNSNIDVMDGGSMTVLIADALIQEGNIIRTRSGTMFFLDESIVAVTTIYDNRYEDRIGRVTEDIPTTIVWNK